MSESEIDAGRRLAFVKEACAYARMGKTKLYEKINDGTFKAFFRDGKTVVDLDTIDAFNKTLPEKALAVRNRPE